MDSSISQMYLIPHNASSFLTSFYLGSELGCANGQFGSNKNNYMHLKFFSVYQIMNQAKLLKISTENRINRFFFVYSVKLKLYYLKRNKNIKSYKN
jgi:hypothetical protein